MVKKHTSYSLSTKKDIRKAEILEVLYMGCVHGAALCHSTDKHFLSLYCLLQVSNSVGYIRMGTFFATFQCQQIKKNN
jgi:hypothetical protein